MILLSNMTQFNQMTVLWIFEPCPNRVEPQKSVSYLTLTPIVTVFVRGYTHAPPFNVNRCRCTTLFANTVSRRSILVVIPPQGKILGYFGGGLKVASSIMWASGCRETQLATSTCCLLRRVKFVQKQYLCVFNWNDNPSTFLIQLNWISSIIRQKNNLPTN